MVSSVRPALRWVLLCVLAFGVIGMHNLTVGAHESTDHMVMTSTATATTPATSTNVVGMSCCGGDHNLGIGLPGHSRDAAHDMLHLCLAVLIAAAVLIMTWLLCRRGHTAWRHHEARTSLVRAGRGPPLAPRTNDLLSSLCVLRL